MDHSGEREDLMGFALAGGVHRRRLDTYLVPVLRWTRSSGDSALISDLLVKSFSSCKSLKALVSSNFASQATASFGPGVASARSCASWRSITALIGMPRQSFDAAMRLA